MTKGERCAAGAVLCALYLRGAPFARCVPRRRWPLVVDALRRFTPSLSDAPRVLRECGLYDEAEPVFNSELVAWGLSAVESGRAATVFDVAYPVGWLESLGAGAPPCAWVRGELPLAPAVAVVGSRALCSADRSFACAVARTLMRGGHALVSGGAVGADSVALDAALASGGAGRCVELLPYGMERAAPSPGVCHVSVCEPWADFTTAQAMERNALIYAYGRRAVVVRARLRAGGTWHGAVDALRRRLGAVYVRPAGPAARALVALGAVPVTGASSLGPLLSAPVTAAQPGLFGSLVVREPGTVPGWRSA